VPADPERGRLRQPQAAILENDGIHELSTLHAAARLKIELTGVIPEIEALLGYHKASAP